MESPADITWKGFSLAERDRRWQRVRDNAAKAGFDCIFVPLCVDGRNLHLSLEQARGTRSDCRFLTQMENAAIVLPTDGRTPVVINDRGSRNPWFSEVRPANRGLRGSWGAPMAEALIDLGMERARIGVSGLRLGKVTHGRAIAGVINHSSYAEVLRRLPNATFEDATDVVGYARYVKSDEEVACLRRGAAIVAAGIEKMAEVAKPGVEETVLYARVMQRMLELGCEYYAMALYTGSMDGDRLPRFENPPIGRRLQPGYRINNETDAVWGGLIAQEVQPMYLGPIPEEWKPVIELQREIFEGGLECMKPGKLFGDLIDFVNGLGPKRGLNSLILMHGRGYGDDGPLLTPQHRGERSRDVVFEKGNTFVWKPIASSRDGQFQFSWGGCVVVNENGGQRLVHRNHGMVSVS